MTKRECVLATIGQDSTNGIVPCNFQATEVVLDKLYQHYKVNTYRELLDCLGSYIVDIRGVVDPVWIARHPKTKILADGTIQNHLGWRMQDKLTVHGVTREHSGYILSECDSIDEMAEFNWMSADWFDFSDVSQRLDEYNGLAVMVSGASAYQHATLLRGLEPLLCDMIAEPELAHYVLGKYVDFYIDYFDRLFSASDKKIDILRMTDDLGMQDRLLISGELFATFIAKNVTRICDMAHSHGVKVLFHSCGAIAPLISDIIATGVDILDPLQPKADGMEPGSIAEKFLGKICLHGGVDTQYTLPLGTTDEVREEIAHLMDTYGRAGTGYIIAPSHSLQPDVKVENIVTMYETIKSYNGE